MLQKIINKVNEIKFKILLTDEETEVINSLFACMNTYPLSSLSLITNGAGEKGICVRAKKGKIVSHIYSPKNSNKRIEEVYNYMMKFEKESE